MHHQLRECLPDVRLEAPVDHHLDPHRIVGADLNLGTGVLGGTGDRDAHHLRKRLVLTRCAHSFSVTVNMTFVIQLTYHQRRSANANAETTAQETLYLLAVRY